jgi:hypothetical protein
VRLLWQGPEAIVQDITDPSSRQRGRYKITNRNCLKEISRRKENWSRVSDGRLTPRQTGRLTVGRKLTSTSTSVVTSEYKYTHLAREVGRLDSLA